VGSTPPPGPAVHTLGKDTRTDLSPPTTPRGPRPSSVAAWATYQRLKENYELEETTGCISKVRVMSPFSFSLPTTCLTYPHPPPPSGISIHISGFPLDRPQSIMTIWSCATTTACSPPQVPHLTYQEREMEQ
jgi:hypothetical protein